MARSSLRTVLELSLARTQLLRAIDGPLSQHGISFGDLSLLLELRGAPERSLRRVELASRLAVTPSGIARQVAPLERIGLVSRSSHPRDARLALVILTDTGTRVADEAEATAEWVAGESLRRLWSVEQLELLDQLLAAAELRR
jgi:DNA-binding MarR family transcriptional regulator